MTTLSSDAILDARAKKYAVLPDVSLNQDIFATVVVLRIGTQHIGISSKNLERIGRTPPIAHLPGLPSLLRGALQNRGELLAAVDTAKCFNIELKMENAFYAVVVHSSGRKLALLVDQVIGFRDIVKTDIVESFLGNNRKGRRPIWAITRDLLEIVNVDAMFENKDIIAVPHASRH